MDDSVNDFAFEEFFDQLDTPQLRAIGTESLDVFPSETPTQPDGTISSGSTEQPLAMSAPITPAPAYFEAPPPARVHAPVTLVPLPAPSVSTPAPSVSTPVQAESRVTTPVAPVSVTHAVHARDEELRAMVESADARIAAWKAQLRSMRRPSLWSRSPFAAVAVVAAVVIVGGTMWSPRRGPVGDPGEPAVVPGVKQAPTSPEPLSPPSLEAAAPELPPRADDSGGTPARRLATTRQAERPRPASASDADAVGTVGRSAAAPPQARRPSPPARHTDAVVVARQPALAPSGASSAATWPTVEVDVTVDTEGHAIKAIALAGDDAWRRAAEAAALQWRYEPATDDGVAVVSELRVRVPFE